jgi:hypothetical protein
MRAGTAQLLKAGPYLGPEQQEDVEGFHIVRDGELKRRSTCTSLTAFPFYMELSPTGSAWQTATYPSIDQRQSDVRVTIRS